MHKTWTRSVRFGRLQLAGTFILLTLAAAGQRPAAQEGSLGYRVDPAWPKPLPAPRDAAGQTHQWITGDVGASCVDSRDHVIVVTRGFQRGGVSTFDGTQSIASPPVLEFDTAGTLVHSWGDATLTSEGVAAVLPNSIHGWF